MGELEIILKFEWNGPSAGVMDLKKLGRTKVFAETRRDIGSAMEEFKMEM